MEGVRVLIYKGKGALDVSQVQDILERYDADVYVYHPKSGMVNSGFVAGIESLLLSCHAQIEGKISTYIHTIQSSRYIPTGQPGLPHDLSKHYDVIIFPGGTASIMQK